MKFQDKVIETTADLRTRATALASIAFDTVRARARAALATTRVEGLKTSLSALQVAGREFNTVARHHMSRFIEENSVIVRDAGRDVTMLARSTYSKLAQREASTARKPRKAAVARKRGSRARPDAKVNAA